MIQAELEKYLSSLSKEELLRLCIRLLSEQMQMAAKLCEELSKLGR